MLEVKSCPSRTTIQYKSRCQCQEKWEKSQCWWNFRCILVFLDVKPGFSNKSLAISKKIPIPQVQVICLFYFFHPFYHDFLSLLLLQNMFVYTMYMLLVWDMYVWCRMRLQVIPWWEDIWYLLSASIFFLLVV